MNKTYMVVHPSVWFFLYHTFQFDEMYVGFWEKGVSQSTWRKTSWCREENQQQTQAKYMYFHNGIDGRNRNWCHFGRSGALLFLQYACTLPQRILPLTCFSFFSLDEKPSLAQIEKTYDIEGYAFCFAIERMLFDFLCFKYLLGEDGENVDQFQVLAHPKVHTCVVKQKKTWFH